MELIQGDSVICIPRNQRWQSRARWQVPLDPLRFDVPGAYEFTLRHLVEAERAAGRELKLIVDLTNTTRCA